MEREEHAEAQNSINSALNQAEQVIEENIALKQKLSEANRKTEDFQKIFRCSVCLAARVSVVLMPCQHACCCKTCWWRTCKVWLLCSGPYVSQRNNVGYRLALVRAHGARSAWRHSPTTGSQQPASDTSKAVAKQYNNTKPKKEFLWNLVHFVTHAIGCCM